MDNKMIRLKDQSGNVVWINKDQLVGVTEMKASPGSNIIMREGLRIHVKEEPDEVMLKFIGT